jgi:hypothetical protein
MRHASMITVAVIALGAGVGSFVGTMAQGERPAALEAPLKDANAFERWLGLSSNQVVEIAKDDPAFTAEAASLAGTLDQERDGLAALLEAVATPDQEILTQVERVIAAHDALERRVAAHVLAVRHHLTFDQQERLMGLCAASVRQASRSEPGRGVAPGGGSGAHGAPRASSGPEQRGQRWRGGRSR